MQLRSVMSTALLGSVLLTSMTHAQEITTAAAQGQPAQEGKLKSFFNKVKETVAKGGKALTAPMGGDLYTPLTEPHVLPGLFKAGSRDQALTGNAQWPRVALTFVEYGLNLSYWTVEARIWTDARTSTVERFKTCTSARLWKINDLGQKSGGYDKSDALTRSKLRRFQNIQPLFGKVKTTAERTQGPNPPRNLFSVDTGPLNEKVFDASINAMWITGFITIEDTSMSSTFFDWRMWIAGFDPNGKRG
jgi:hypothetical protein